MGRGIGTGTWAGIVMAYDSYTWPPAHQGWPVSFFVVVLVLAAYLLAQLKGRRAAHQNVPPGAPALDAPHRRPLRLGYGPQG